MGMGIPYWTPAGAGAIPATALFEDDGVTPLYEDDGITILFEDV